MVWRMGVGSLTLLEAAMGLTFGRIFVKKQHKVMGAKSHFGRMFGVERHLYAPLYEAAGSKGAKVAEL